MLVGHDLVGGTGVEHVTLEEHDPVDGGSDGYPHHPAHEPSISDPEGDVDRVAHLGGFDGRVGCQRVLQPVGGCRHPQVSEADTLEHGFVGRGEAPVGVVGAPEQHDAEEHGDDDAQHLGSAVAEVPSQFDGEDPHSRLTIPAGRP